MKKKFILAAIICCALTTVFTSCNEEDKTKPEPEDLTPVAAVMNYTLKAGDEILNSFNVTIEYYDADGQLKTEPMTAKEWTKDVKADLPATLGARMTIQPKEGVNFENLEQFTAAYGYSYRGYAVSANDKVVGQIVSNGIDTTLPMKGDKVSIWQERHADGIVKFLFTFDAEGKADSSSWE